MVGSIGDIDDFGCAPAKKEKKAQRIEVPAVNTQSITKSQVQLKNTINVISQLGETIKNSNNEEELIKNVISLKNSITQSQEQLNGIIDNIIDTYCPEKDRKEAKALGHNIEKVSLFINKKLAAEKAKAPEPERAVYDKTINLLKSDVTQFNDLYNSNTSALIQTLTTVKLKALKNPGMGNFFAASIELEVSMKCYFKNFEDKQGYDNFEKKMQEITSLYRKSGDLEKKCIEKVKTILDFQQKMEDMRQRLADQVQKTVEAEQKAMEVAAENRKAEVESDKAEKNDETALVIKHVTKKKQEKQAQFITAMKNFESNYKEIDVIKNEMKQTSQLIINLSADINTMSDRLLDFNKLFGDSWEQLSKEITGLISTDPRTIDFSVYTPVPRHYN